MLPLPLAVSVPPVQVVEPLGVAATSTPAGRVLEKSSAVAAVALALLSMVNVTVAVPSARIVPGAIAWLNPGACVAVPLTVKLKGSSSASLLTKDRPKENAPAAVGVYCTLNCVVPPAAATVVLPGALIEFTVTLLAPDEIGVATVRSAVPVLVIV